MGLDRGGRDTRRILWTRGVLVIFNLILTLSAAAAAARP